MKTVYMNILWGLSWVFWNPDATHEKTSYQNGENQLKINNFKKIEQYVNGRGSIPLMTVLTSHLSLSMRWSATRRSTGVSGDAPVSSVTPHNLLNTCKQMLFLKYPTHLSNPIIFPLLFCNNVHYFGLNCPFSQKASKKDFQ